MLRGVRGFFLGYVTDSEFSHSLLPKILILVVRLKFNHFEYEFSNSMSPIEHDP